MQRMMLIGNICNDLEVQETATGKKRLAFSVAVKRDYTRAGEERFADFFDCLSWGNTAENIAKWCKKGDKIYVDGKIETRYYEDNNGVKTKAIDLIVERVEFLGVKKERIDETKSAEETETRSAKRSRPTMQPMDDIDGEIPF